MTVGKYAYNKQYEEAIKLIKELDDVILILAIAYGNEGYDITGETSKVAELLVKHAKENFNATFTAHVAVNISEHKGSIDTCFLDAEDSFLYHLTHDDNPCIEIYEQLSIELYKIAIEKSQSEEDDEIISDYLEYEGYTLEEFKEKFLDKAS